MHFHRSNPVATAASGALIDVGGPPRTPSMAAFRVIRWRRGSRSSSAKGGGASYS